MFDDLRLVSEFGIENGKQDVGTGRIILQLADHDRREKLSRIRTEKKFKVQLGRAEVGGCGEEPTEPRVPRLVLVEH